ncbi:hypothetical protein PAPYR_5489 [Paratrimastix pyriformis]|uniref:Uncharacterized protein n=1 Tax=Paratrimastix pyriformis TaxID=342808 RepID=A0ABQ8UIV6_9EUKA|nr:hypothetical protein PAPYR_5489 [Paratrimastix pyriformis]
MIAFLLTLRAIVRHLCEEACALGLAPHLETLLPALFHVLGDPTDKARGWTTPSILTRPAPRPLASCPASALHNTTPGLTPPPPVPLLLYCSASGTCLPATPLIVPVFCLPEHLPSCPTPHITRHSSHLHTHTAWGRVFCLPEHRHMPNPTHDTSSHLILTMLAPPWGRVFAFRNTFHPAAPELFDLVLELLRDEHVEVREGAMPIVGCLARGLPEAELLALVARFKAAVRQGITTCCRHPTFLNGLMNNVFVEQ